MEVPHAELALNTRGALIAHLEVSCCSVSHCPTDLIVSPRKKCLVLSVVSLCWGGSPPLLTALGSPKGSHFWDISCLARVSETLSIFDSTLRKRGYSLDLGKGCDSGGICR